MADRLSESASASTAAASMRPRRSLVSRVLRAIARALLLAFVFGFTIGTLIRCTIERSATPPLQYLG